MRLIAWLLAVASIIGAGHTSAQEIQISPPIIVDSTDEMTHVLIYVTVPDGAILEVDGVPVKQTGPERRLITPPFRVGQKGDYTLKATFKKDGKDVVVERKITVVGGQVSRVDLTKDAPVAVVIKDVPKVEPKVEPKVTPKVEPKVEPKMPPKVEPMMPPKVEPKVEPKVTPKVEPKVTPKVEPKMPPKVEPKVEPKVTPKVEPKTDNKKDPPKVEPKMEPKKDIIKVPYVPTPESVVTEMLKLAGVKEGEVVFDLGCGDGRIPIAAVKDFKAKKGFGLDIDPVRIKECNENAKTAKVEAKVEFKVGDVLELKDVSEANVVTLYLFPEVNERLAPMLQKTLKPGARVVSHDFLIGDWKFDKEITVKDGAGDEHTLYLWIIPEKKK